MVEKYSDATGESADLPPAFSSRQLEGITHEPLLCYLLVLAGYATRDWEKAAENINIIYSTLMNNIYERGWGEGLHKRHGAGRTTTLPDFLKLMKTIGLAAWLGGDARIASEESFRNTLEITNAKNEWSAFERDNGPDVTNLAMNFYLKSSEGSQRGFEFTHKSFGEYLSANAILDVAVSMPSVGRHRLNYAMREWFNATSSGRLSREVLNFLRNEVRARYGNNTIDIAALESIKTIFENMASAVIVEGFPAEGSFSWRIQESHQENSELSLWSVLNAVVRVLAVQYQHETVISIPELDNAEFSALLGRHSRGGIFSSSILPNCMSNLQASEFIIVGTTFNGGSLEGAKLVRSIFDNCRFYSVNFSTTDLRSATFYNCIFHNCRFDKANIEFTGLLNCIISETNFQVAAPQILRITPATVFLSDDSINGIDKRCLRYEYDPEDSSKLENFDQRRAFLEDIGMMSEEEYSSFRAAEWRSLG
jgi:hypothetical protein